MRARLKDPQLRLPRIKLYGGRFGRVVTKNLNIGAITLGRRIIVSPNLVKTDAEGRMCVPAWLLAHEGTHVMQYERAGLFGFFASYLGNYFRIMLAGRKFSGRAHNAAYFAIEQEQDAREAEYDYRRWCEENGIEGDQHTLLPLDLSKS
jgi:hypothetical protein